MTGALGVALLLGLSPRIQNVARLEFKYPRRELRFALIVSLIAVIVNFILFSINGIEIPEFLTNLDANIYVPLLFSSLVVIIIVFIILRARWQPNRSAGWNKALLRPAIQFGLALVLLTLFLRGKFISIMSGVPQNALPMLIILLVIALAEETIFRGYIQLRFISSIGKWGGWLAATLIFTIWRVPFLLGSGLAGQHVFYEIGLLFLQGLLLGWIMIKSRHVLVSALYHAFSMWILFL